MRSKLFIISVLCMFATSINYAQEVATPTVERGLHKGGELMQVEMHGGKPFMDVLREKQHMAHISERELEPHHLSGVLWVANGTPQPGEMHNRTAFAPMDLQYVKIYVLMKEGLFEYQADMHKLEMLAPIDFRRKISDDDQFHRAPIAVVYVIDRKATSNVSNEDRKNYAYLQSGCISQNILLYCSSEDMASNIVFDIKKEELAKKLKVEPGDILFGQAIGYGE